MKALILNSGTGTRMGKLIDNSCKCLVEISDGVTIFDLQISSLLEAGITEFCITTGHNSNKLINYANKNYPGVKFNFIHNPKFDTTNYIYSIYLAREFLQDDILLTPRQSFAMQNSATPLKKGVTPPSQANDLVGGVILIHGDLVFDNNVLHNLITCEKSAMVIDTTKPLPEKDFKAVIKDNKVVTVGVNEFGAGDTYAQPMYKLNKKDWFIWLNEIIKFCENEVTNVYAENAFNEVSNKMNIKPLDIAGGICFEIDNAEDLDYGKSIYPQLQKQQMFTGFGSFKYVESIIAKLGVVRPFVVCSKSVKSYMKDLFSGAIDAVFFSDFTPNPKLSQVMSGIKEFENNNCDFIISFGGGSAIDVAKCVNVLNDSETDLLNDPRCKHLAIPTTAGTGSESTAFAVVYKGTEKLSIEHFQGVPSFVILDPSFLESLPLYHKKSTLLDAFCQSIESIWAKQATNESKVYAKKAISLILENWKSYINGDMASAEKILLAANLAGKAINISKTTAPHAMSYGLSSMLNIAHGHAVAMCMLGVWDDLLGRCSSYDDNSCNNNNDSSSSLNSVLDEIAKAFDVDSINEAFAEFEKIYKELDMPDIGEVSVEQVEELSGMVNGQRLKNHPVVLSDEVVIKLYKAMFM